MILLANCAPHCIVKFGWSAGISLSALPSAIGHFPRQHDRNLQFCRRADELRRLFLVKREIDEDGRIVDVDVERFALTGCFTGNVKFNVRIESFQSSQ